MQAKAAVCSVASKGREITRQVCLQAGPGQEKASPTGNSLCCLERTLEGVRKAGQRESAGATGHGTERLLSTSLLHFYVMMSREEK